MGHNDAPQFIHPKRVDRYRAFEVIDGMAANVLLDRAESAERLCKEMSVVLESLLNPAVGAIGNISPGTEYCIKDVLSKYRQKIA